MGKKLLAMLLASVLALSSLPITMVVAASENEDENQNYSAQKIEIWDGTVADSFAGGSGTVDDPYLISNGAELAYLEYLTALGNWGTRGKYYALTQDIYLNDVSDFKNWNTVQPSNKWTPIGSRAEDDSKQFFGNFNGNGYTVFGAYTVDYDGEIGLFGNVDGATISNLRIIDCYFAGNAIVGGIAGVSRKGSLFYNCYSNCVIQAQNGAGGIVGRDDSGIFRYCCNEGKVTGGENVGGILGSSGGEASNYATGTIEYCYNTGKISGNAYVGGITGGVAYLSDCYNTGTVTANRHFVGGIAGFLSYISLNTNYIRRCYNVGTVACMNVEGLREDRIRIGAIVGEQGFWTSISNVYYLNTMNVTDLEGEGWHMPNIEGGLSKEEMHSEERFAGFDFQNTWFLGMDSEYLYPQLVFPDMQRYAVLRVTDSLTNEAIDDYTVELNSDCGLVYVEVDGVHYIVGSGETFASGEAITISKEGYEDFLCYSNDLETSVSPFHGDSNVIYLTPSTGGDSEQDEIQKKYILEHVDFYENRYHQFVTKNGFQTATWQYENGESFFWANVGNWLDNINDAISLDFSDIKLQVSYYDIFVMDLMASMVDVEADDIYNMAAWEKTETVTKWMKTIKNINSKKENLFTKTQLDAWNRLWNEMEYAGTDAVMKDIDLFLTGEEAGEAVYMPQIVKQIGDSRILTEYPDILEDVFDGLSLLNEVCEYVTNASDTIKAFRDTTQAYIILATYAELNEKLYTVIEEATDKMDFKYAFALRVTIEKYRFEAANIQRLYRACLNDLSGYTVKFVWDSFVSEYVKKALYNQMAQTLGCPASAVQTIFIAYKLGYGFCDWVTGSSDKAEQYTFMYYLAPLEASLENVVKEYGDKLLKDKSYENAEMFDYSYRALAATNKYLYNCLYTYGASGVEMPAIGNLYIGRIPAVMEYGSSMVYAWDKMLCHGNANFVNNQYKYTSIQCPVDVYVYNEANELVVSIVNEEVVEYAPSFTVFVYNEKKTLIYPTDQDYSLRIIARESGVMDYYVAEVTGDSRRNIDFYNIPLTENQEFVGEVPVAFDIDSADYALRTVSGEIDANYDSKQSATSLSAPTGLVWEGTVASWECVDNATAYLVGLYRDGEQIQVVQANENVYDFKNSIAKAGEYAFYVIALGDGETFLDSRKSANSRVMVVENVEAIVSFDANGGVLEQASAETIGGKLGSLPVPDYEGCDFVGWYTKPIGGEKVTTDTVFDVDTIIYAHWKIHEHIFDFDMMPEFCWSENYKTCTVNAICAVCQKTVNLPCEVTDKIKNATCVENGTIIYTATVNFSGKTYTDIKNIDGEMKLGHDYRVVEVLNETHRLLCNRCGGEMEEPHCYDNGGTCLVCGALTGNDIVGPSTPSDMENATESTDSISMNEHAQTNESPKTGDDSLDIWFSFIMLAVSFGGAVMILRLHKIWKRNSY